MRRILLATVAVLAFTGPAKPQLFGGITGGATEATQVASWAKQVADMARQLQQMQAQYQQLVMTYNALTRVTDLGSAVSALNMLGIQNPLPVNPYAAQSLLSGRGGAQGMIGSLGSLYTGTLHGNSVYALPQDTWIGRQSAGNAAALAGAQALSLQLYQSAAERVTGLNELQARINTAADPSEREALIARISAEQAYIQNQQVQASNIGNYMVAQLRVMEQQREERLHQSIDEVLNDARSRGWWQ